MAKYEKIAVLKYGKAYRAVVDIPGRLRTQHFSKMFFKTASMAVAYSDRLEKRYTRLKAAQIAQIKKEV